MARHIIYIVIFLLLFLQADVDAGIYINEIMADNVLSFPNSEGDYEDWIELYNSGDLAVNLAGYYLTDDLNNKWLIPDGYSQKTTIPGKGYLIISADSKKQIPYNASFGLDQQGEFLYLIGKDGSTIVDYVKYPEQLRDISYGRWPDGGTTWKYMQVISPGTINKPGYADFTKPPIIDKKSGLYENAITILMQAEQPGELIRYTLDGSDPKESSVQYNAPLQINSTCVLRARSFREGFLAGNIVSQSYFIIQQNSLPILSLITDPKNLYDPLTGIYVHDFDGRLWERYSELEYFPDGKLQFHIPAGIRIQGNTGPMDYLKKSFRLFFRKGYGKDELIDTVYAHDKSANTRLVLRSGYDDSLEPTLDGKNNKGTLIRDPLITELWRRTGNPVAQSKFSMLYVDGAFQGIYDIKQSLDEDFVKSRMNYNDVDIIRTRWDSTELVYGSRTKWNELLSYFQSNTFESEEMLVNASEKLDLENYITLQAFVHLAGYYSWSYGVFMFREKIEHAKWKFLIWDSDRAFNDVNWNGFTAGMNPVGYIFDNNITKKLLQNQSFRNRFINGTADLLNTLFVPSNINYIIDSLSNVIRTGIPAECLKWKSNVEKWEANIDTLKSYTLLRPGIVRTQFIKYFGLSGTSKLTLEAGNSGSVQVNTILPLQFPWSGTYFNGIPVSLKAIAPAGYIFAGWNDPSIPQTDSVAITLSGDKTVKAIFRKLESSNIELIVPASVPLNHDLPLIIRVRDENWNIDPINQAPVIISADGIIQDTSVKIKRGAGAGLLKIRSDKNFVLRASRDNSSQLERNILINTGPDKNYSGTIGPGEIVWDNSAIRHITNHLTIPAGTTLRIKQGTWILIGQKINLYVRGKIIVEGTQDEPVVITSESADAWGGMEFTTGEAEFRFCIISNGGGDLSRGQPTAEGWHTGRQHIFFGKDNSLFSFNNCFFLFSPGKVFGAQDSRVNVSNSVTSTVWLGGEFHRVLLNYKDSHLMNLPNDDHIYLEDIDTDGFHIDWVNSNYPQYSLIENCYFITGKDDAIDHHAARLKVNNCWLEDFMHEGVAASGGDTIQIFNSISLKNDQGFEAGWTDGGVTRGPIVIIDHCAAIDNNVGLRIGDSYAWTYKDFMKVTNTILYNNKDNVWNYLNSTHAPLAGALDISFSMVNDEEYNNSLYCVTGTPQFDPYYYLLKESIGSKLGTRGTDLGRADSASVNLGLIVINEIMYNESSDRSTGDWIELYNPLPTDENIGEWVIKDNSDSHSFIIPSGTVIKSKSYLVICADSSSFRKYYAAAAIIGNINFGFGSDDEVRLYNNSGILMDSVQYSASAPWDNDADGKGYSLELMDPAKVHTIYFNWSKSYVYGGSPGFANQNSGTAVSEAINEYSFNLYQNYPNPFNPVTRILYDVPSRSHVELKIIDMLGKEVCTLVDEEKDPGKYEAVYEVRETGSGVYIYRLTIGDKTVAKKMMILK